MQNVVIFEYRFRRGDLWSPAGEHSSPLRFLWLFFGQTNDTFGRGSYDQKVSKSAKNGGGNAKRYIL